jgi:hypothetical protein
MLSLLFAGRRPCRWIGIAALALASYAAWSLASVAWGGVPDVAWTTFDEALIGAAALVLGSLLACGGLAPHVIGGVTAGLTAEAIELLYRLQAGPVPAEWFDGRKIQGPVGYANAQASLLAVGIPLALWLASHRSTALRAAGGAAAAVLLGALLLTQSRAAVVVLALALIVQVALSRDARTVGLTLALVGVGAVLWRPLRQVDRALVDGALQTRLAAFRHDVHWVVLGAAAVALLAATPPRVPWVRRALVGGAVVSVLAAAALTASRPETRHELWRLVTRGETSVEPADLPPGATRFSSISFTGRLELWGVAWRLYERHPLVGAGKGAFARTWDRERTNLNYSVLQPHSLELEALSELGIPGILAVVGFTVSALVALLMRRQRQPALAAAGVAVLLVTMLQASVDWTFSFPALLVAALLAVGVAAGPGRRRRTRVPVKAALVLIALAVVISYGAPYMAAHDLAQAQRLAARHPLRAWAAAARARSYDRWNPDVVDLQAQIAARTGNLGLSASLYARAAELALRPWREQARRAEVLQRAGRGTASQAACRMALKENPLELALRTGVCGDVSP